jgi:hypothetical protein
MKKINSLSAWIVAAYLTLCLTNVTSVLAASTPSLGAAEPYGILGSTYTNTSATTVTGEVGFTTGPAVPPSGTHTNYGSVPPYATAGSDQATAVSSLTPQACTFSFAAGSIDLATDVTHGTIASYVPGVYCSTGAMDISAPITLNGNGTYIFRSTGALTSAVGAAVALSGASACDVFWTPTQATTLAANTTFVGTIIDDAGITVGANSTVSGRLLSFGGTITTDTNTVTVPSCASVIPPAAPAPQNAAPANQGTSSGGGGGFTHVTPLINLTKTASPTSLPGGPGRVNYSYTVTDAGNAQSLAGVSLVDDMCAPVSFLSGDTNLNSKLDIGETWRYSCSTILSRSTTNTATVTAHSDDAYNQSVSMVARATVVVGGAPVATLASSQIAAAGIASPSADSIPAMPDTGFAPEIENGGSMLWYGAGLLAAFVTILGYSLYVALKKRTVEVHE